MKTKILILVAFIVVTLNVHSQIYLVDTNTTHVVGGNVITGDPLPLAFTKIDLSLTWLNNFCATNSATNAALTLAVGTLKTNFNTLSNSFTVLSNLYSARFSGTNLYNGSVNSNKFDTITMAWLNAIGWTQILNGTNLQSGTVNSNALDADTLTWLQSIPMPGAMMNFDGGTITSDGSGNIVGTSFRGGLLDNGASSGASGYAPLANGDGTWTWGTVSGGGGGGITDILFTNTTTLPAGSAATATNLGVVGGIAFFQIGIPQGATPTNTITAYNFTNQFLGSQEIILTNITRNLTGSNYLGRFPNYTRWVLQLPSLGGGGATPGTNPTENVWVSLTGTNNWFQATNGVPIFTNVSISIVGANIGTNLAVFKLSSTDKPELWGKTNFLYGQKIGGIGTPVDSGDIATKGYTDGVFASAQGLLSTVIETNGISHTYLTKNGIQVLDVSSVVGYIGINSIMLDGTGTNIVLSITQTNLTAGWVVESITNLLYVNSWQSFTNYTPTTNSGIVNLTFPMLYSEQYFRARGNITNTFKVNSLLQVSNTLAGGGVFQFYVQTNTPTIGDLGNQKGGRLWFSNGVLWATGSTNGSSVYTSKIVP